MCTLGITNALASHLQRIYAYTHIYTYIEIEGGREREETDRQAGRQTGTDIWIDR